MIEVPIGEELSRQTRRVAYGKRYRLHSGEGSDRRRRRRFLRTARMWAPGARPPNRLLTTRAVVLKIGNALATLRYRDASVRLLEVLESDPQIAVIPITDELYRRAFELYRSRSDKEWGLTDCISFTVMQERGVSEALTTDVHFRQAGLRSLLLEEASA